MLVLHILIELLASLFIGTKSYYLIQSTVIINRADFSFNHFLNTALNSIS